MRKYLVIGAAACAAALVFWAILASRSSTDAPAPPPLAGEMQKFTPADTLQPAPEPTLVARDGTTQGLDAWRGKIVLINFWATWCAPCVREMPSLQRLEAKLGGENFAVIALSQDLKGWDAIAPFLARHGLDRLTVLHDPKGAASRAFGVQGLPVTVLLDAEGRILGRLVGAAEWDGAEAVALIRHYMDAGAAR